MNICVAQLSVLKGNIESNIAEHINLINTAIEHGASAIFFPELSITGYEPASAQDLAFEKDDIRLDVFHELSDTNNIVMGVGLPT